MLTLWKTVTFLHLVHYLIVSLLPQAYAIVDGRVISVTEAPHQAAIYQRGEYRCGGSIVAPQWILTSAHCVVDATDNVIPPKGMLVRVGTDDASEFGEFQRTPDGTFVNPRFTYKSLDYDIALLRLAEPVLYSNRVRCIKLAPPDAAVPDDSTVFVSGYGRQNQDTSKAQEDTLLRLVEVSIFDHDDCRNRYGTELNLPITDRMFCAGAPGKGPCINDAGSPAVLEGTLLGVVSGGNTCGNDRFPGVYALVPAARQWIDETMAEHSTHQQGYEECF